MNIIPEIIASIVGCFVVFVWFSLIFILDVFDSAVSSNRSYAEKVWLKTFKEIPDGFCLVYTNGTCRLQQVVKKRMTLEEWLRLPPRISAQVDL